MVVVLGVVDIGYWFRLFCAITVMFSDLNLFDWGMSKVSFGVDSSAKETFN